MTGTVLTQVLVSIAVGAPLLVVAGAIITFGIGGIIGCAECLMARLGSVRMPGVVSTGHHHGHIAAGA